MVLFFERRRGYSIPNAIFIENFSKDLYIFSEIFLKIFKSDYLNLRGESRCLSILNTIMKSIPVSSPPIRKSEENSECIHKFRFGMDLWEIKRGHKIIIWSVKNHNCHCEHIRLQYFLTSQKLFGYVWQSSLYEKPKEITFSWKLFISGRFQIFSEIHSFASLHFLLGKFRNEVK